MDENKYTIDNTEQYISTRISERHKVISPEVRPYQIYANIVKWLHESIKLINYYHWIKSITTERIILFIDGL